MPSPALGLSTKLTGLEGILTPTQAENHCAAAGRELQNPWAHLPLKNTTSLSAKIIRAVWLNTGSKPLPGYHLLTGGPASGAAQRSPSARSCSLKERKIVTPQGRGFWRRKVAAPTQTSSRGHNGYKRSEHRA